MSFCHTTLTRRIDPHGPEASEGLKMMILITAETFMIWDIQVTLEPPTSLRGSKIFQNKLLDITVTLESRTFPPGAEIKKHNNFWDIKVVD